MIIKNIYGNITAVAFKAFLISISIVVIAKAQEKAAVHIGPFDVTPELELSYEKDDNALSDISGNEVEQNLTLVRPSLTALADNGVVSYKIRYQLENGSSKENPQNDYTDQTLAADMLWQLDIRHLIEFATQLDYGHQARSIDSVTDVGVADLNEFTDKGFSGKYTFGSEGAKGRLVIGFDTNSLRYDTNLSDTRVLESDVERKNIEFSVAFNPLTRVTFEINEAKNMFRNNSAVDRIDRNMLLGLAWDFTGVTKGNFSLGRSQNDLVNSSLDTSSSTGRFQVEWTPYVFSSFTFTADKSARNTENNVGSFVDSESIAVAWRYAWTERLTMNSSFNNQKNDFVGTNRQDTSQNIQLGLDYTFRRWLRLGINVSLQERDSSDNAVDFEKNIVTLSLTTNL